MLSVRVTRWLLLLLLALFLTGLPVLPTAAQTCLSDGDVNEDGTLTPADALLAFQQFLGRAQPPLTDCQQVRANVFQSKSSAITPADALCIFQQSLTLPSCLTPQLASPDGTEIQFLVNTPHPLTLGLVNAEGQPVPAAPVSFQITAGDGTLSATAVQTDAAGQATTILTVGATPGLNVVEAQITGLVPVVFTITGVVAEQVRGTVEVSGNTQAAPPGTVLDVPFIVRAEDEFGQPVAGIEVTVSVRGAGAEIAAQPPALVQGQGSLAVQRQSESTTAVAVTNARGEARFVVRGVVGVEAEDIVAEVTVLDQMIEVPIVLDGALLPDPTNTSPRVTSPADQVVAEGEGIVLPIIVSDPDGDTLTFSATNLPPGLSIAPDSGRITGTVASTAAQSSPFIAAITVSDGTAATSVPLALTVTDPAPRLAAIGNQTVSEGSTQSVRVTATDPGGDRLTLSALNLPNFATFTDNGDGTGLLLLAPNFADAGTFSVTITVMDNNTPLGTASETFMILVNDVPPPPNMRRLTVVLGGNGSGTVTSVPAGINCGTACSQDYDFGTVVTLTATPVADSEFVGWSGEGCSGTSTCQVTLDQVRTVTATFRRRPVRLTVVLGGNGSGTVTSVPVGIDCGQNCTQDYDFGTVVTLTATPVADSEFVGWSGEGCSGTSTCQVTLGQVRTVTATFRRRPVRLTVVPGGRGSGTVTSVPAGIDCGQDCIQDYNFGTVVTLTATPTNDSEFAGWSGVVGCAPDGSDNICIVTMDQSRTLTANFTALQPFDPIVECISGATGGDQIFRGFHLPNYPGNSLARVQLFLSADTPGDYTFSLALRQNTYDGALLGTSTAAVTLSGNSRDNQRTTFAFPTVTVVAGTTITFALQQVSGPTSTVFYAVPVDDPQCPVVQTEDTRPPLSTFRRNGVEIRIFAEPPGEVEGRVVDFVTRLGLDTVDLDFINSSGRLVGRAQSNADGFYFLSLPAGATLGMASRAGFISTTIDFAVVADTRTTVDVIALVPESGSPGDISGTIRNAITGEGIADVTIDLRSGVNSTSDEIVASTRTDSLGAYAFSTLPAGTYTAMLTRAGFLPNTFTVGVVGGTLTGRQDGTMAPEPVLGEVQIILTWGDEPSDLDAHLTGPKPASTPASSSNPACASDPETFHLFFPCAERNSGSPFPEDFTLDLDDTSSFGPETITLTHRLNGTYRYSVHDFTNRLSTESTVLANSGAQVRIFIGEGQPLTFNVPPGMPGTVWTVFELDGATGAITPLNEFRFEPDAANIGSF